MTGIDSRHRKISTGLHFQNGHHNTAKIQHCSISKVAFDLFFKPVVSGRFGRLETSWSLYDKQDVYHTSVTEFFRWSWHQCQCLYLSYICYRVLQMKLISMSMPLFIIHLLQSSSDEADINVNAIIKSPKQCLGTYCFCYVSSSSYYYYYSPPLSFFLSFFLSVLHELVHCRSQELLDRISWNLVEL